MHFEAQALCGAWKLLGSLPSPPAFERYVLENQWPLAVGLVAAGVCLFLVLNGRGEMRKGLWSGVAGLALGAAVGAAGLLVTTDRESARAQTRAFVDAAVAADSAAVDGMVSEALMIVTGGQAGRNGTDLGKQWLIGVVDDFDRLGVGWHRVSRMSAAETGNGVVTVRFVVTVQTDMPGAPLTSTEWEAVWTRGETERWLLRTLNCRRVNGEPANARWINYAPWVAGG